MKTVFAGTTEFGIPALEILRRDFDLALVITQPDRRVGRKQTLTPPPVKVWAEKNGIKVLQPERISEIENEIRAIAPEVMVVAAYGQIIPKSILGIPGKGSINLHTSLLPKYRGASPIQNAILNGDAETGMTIIQMDEKMDNGPILAQSKMAIENDDSYTTLHKKLADDAAQLLAQTLPKYLAGEITPQPQDKSMVSMVTTINRDNARISWTDPARKIYNQIRALNPEPGTWTKLGDKSIKILEATETTSNPMHLAGTIYASGKDCLVKCGEYSLRLITVQPEGRKPISGTDFLNGIKGSGQQIFT